MATAPLTPSAPPRYTRTAVVLHWLLAAAILGALAVGATAADLPVSPQKLKLVNWHKWAGITILALSLLRLAWRLTHRPPPAPAMPRWQARAAALTHAALYLLFVAVPLAGWSYSAAAGFPVVLFGVLPLPDPVGKDRALADLLRDVHGALAWTLALLVVLHVAAALKHQFVDRDGLIGRMGWRRS
jgi:cytochrome b561